MSKEGFDSLVDRLMACDGYDRHEAELLALQKLGFDRLADAIEKVCVCDDCDCDPGDCACGCVA